MSNPIVVIQSIIAIEDTDREYLQSMAGVRIRITVQRGQEHVIVRLTDNAADMMANNINDFFETGSAEKRWLMHLKI